jgi:hydroxyacylglutathione hydrolase
MSLSAFTFKNGPLENNTYLVVDDATLQCAVIDPSFDLQAIEDVVSREGYQLTAIWLTHAHFDHIAGAHRLAESTQPPLPIFLHPADLPIWKERGGAVLFGIDFHPGLPPDHFFHHGQKLQLGDAQLEVFHTPGHSPGHVVLYCAEAGIVFCGDLIFQYGVGRTDLPGGNQDQLLSSIYQYILTLPPETRLLSGHGPETTVAAEVEFNPYLN